jgi:hypothetical protein
MHTHARHTGVFNGEESLSKRARIPATNAIIITNALHTGSALNTREGTHTMSHEHVPDTCVAHWSLCVVVTGVFYRRSYFKPCIACAQADIEQRWCVCKRTHTSHVVSAPTDSVFLMRVCDVCVCVCVCGVCACVG